MTAHLNPIKRSLKRRCALQRLACLGGAAVSGCATTPPPQARALPAAESSTVQPTATPPPPSITVLAPNNAAVATPRRRAQLGLALGGGAARGFAHIGVIAELERAGLTADWIVGTSAGGLVGALYASGMNAAGLTKAAMNLDESSLTDWTILGRGVMKGQGLQDLVNRLVGNRRIEQLPRRLAVTATDLYNGSLKLFTSGDCGQVVRASSAVPTIFEPVKIDGREYVDGGLSSPIPVASARRLGCDVVIAVDISAQPSFQPTETMPQILLQTFAITGRNMAERELAEADIRVRPTVSDLGGANFEARQRAINEGQTAMRAQLPALLAHLRAVSG
jgi:NTE family protein